MSEIPMPEPDGYEPTPTPTKKKRGCCSRTVMCIGIIAIVVVGVIAVTVLLGGPEPEYGERVVADYNNSDIDLSDITFYRDEFSVSSSETMTSTQPDLLFQITVDTGSDSVSVSVHIAVYELDIDTFDSIETWAETNDYLVAENDFAPPVNNYLDLYNYAETYTWVIWFDASGKTDTWSVDITLTLRYNWS